MSGEIVLLFPQIVAIWNNNFDMIYLNQTKFLCMDNIHY